VFLDLLERFPRHGPAGVTIYDAGGSPRAWSGWSPTATMSLSREPSRDSDVVQIREGNIYTLLESTHPIRSDGALLGYVVYQEPLRVQFPLENRLLRVEDVLERLEGGGGVRADVALELAVTDEDAIGSIRPGPVKLSVEPDVASASATIVSRSGAPVGRVSLSGLSRRMTVDESVARWARIRGALLLAVAILAGAHLWFLVAKARLGARLRPAGIFACVARIGLVVAGRWGLRSWSRDAFDPLGVFDPSWFASIRFAGLLRSPGDVLFTAVALVLVGREIRHFLSLHEPAIRAWGRRRPLLALAPGAFGAMLVGSAVGLHWTRTMDIARNANVPLFGGLDPFTSAPVAALELALLLAGASFLLWGDALVTLASGLLGRLPARAGAAVVAGLAIFGSAVKMGDPREVSPGDFLLPLPALAALAAFRWAARRWDRPGGRAILLVALLATASNFAPLFAGIEARRRELVELFALEHAESPSNARHFLLENTLDYLRRSDQIAEALDGEATPEQANLAFILWARSPLANVAAGCHLRILGDDGETFSTFSLGYPAEFREPPPDAPRFRREEIGSMRIDLYSGRAPVERAGRQVGELELSLAYYDDLRRPGKGSALPAVFTNLSAPEEFLRFTREVPDRIDRYRGEVLVASTDPEGGLGKRVPSIIVQALADSDGGRWVERRMGDRLYDLYCVRERDGELTVGYLTFGIARHGWMSGGSLLARSALVTLVLAVAAIVFLMTFSWVAPDPRRIDIPKLGFRERVIAGFLVVSLLPTVFLGFAGRGLFVQEKRKEFQERLEEDLRVSRELLGRRLSDAAHNAAGSEEVLDLFRSEGEYRVLSTPASVDGIVVVEEGGRLLGGSRSEDLAIPGDLPAAGTATEFFRRRGSSLYACAVVPVSPRGAADLPRGGDVIAFQRVDPVLAAELERRVGSSVSFFTNGLLSATSKPELYQSEILSDLVESIAYLKIELEGARRTLLESRVGASSFLSSYAPLSDERGEPVGILATLAPFQGGGLDLDASLVLSRIYFLCLLVFAGAISAAVVLANRLTRPITELTAGAERIGAGNLGHRIVTRASGEIGALVRSFNLMSTRLAESDARDRERREYIEAIIRHVASGVISFDAGGRVATVNEAAARILGVEASSLVGIRPGPSADNAALAALVRAAEPVISGGRREVVHEIEAPPAGPEGEPRTIRLVGTPLVDREGASQGAVVVFEDLSDLIRSEKIKAWAEMARQVAHEIKNPLTPMKLSAQHLRQAWRDKHPKLDRIVEESTETIIDRCEALRRIAIEFSDYARMPGRRIRREDLGRLLHEARRLYGEAADRSVRFTLDAPEASMWTRVDKDEVMRLFINLFENSIQAMPRGGDLAVTAEQQNGCARVVIRDTGTGISRENLTRIFEPSFSTKTGGAGLGLPICKAIMEDYGGSIDITSVEGSGTTVTLVFPSDDAPEAE
jgi:PAS domain S-box-containing protein